MDLDQHNENSFFSFDGYNTDDIMVKSDDECDYESECAQYQPSTFKKSPNSEISDWYDYSPNFNTSKDDDLSVSPILEKMLSLNKSDTDAETEYSNPRQQPSCQNQKKTLKKSTFTDRTQTKSSSSSADSSMGGLKDILNPTSSLLSSSKQLQGFNPSLLFGDSENITKTALQNQVKRTPSEPEVHNIVSTADLKCTLNLKLIAMNARNTEYNPKRFDAAIMKIRNPKTTALIFASGKIVCSGAKSEEDSKRASKKFAKTLQNMGYDVRFTNFRIVNMVAAADAGFNVSLPNLSSKHTEYCNFEPEIFAGLIYRVYKPKVTLMIFSTGKMNIVGAQCREDIYQAYKLIFPILRKYRKEEPAITKC